MKKFAKQEEEAEVNMTPMLDIVFIMLIFFIVTATFVKESGLDINTPEDNNNSNPLEPDPENRPIAFVVDASNRITFERRNIELASVASIIKGESVERPEAPVIIQVASGGQTANVIGIYDEALQLGFARDKIVIVERKK